MLAHLLLLTLVLQAVTVVRLLRRFELAQRGYLLLAAAVLAMALFAIVNENAFLGVVSVCLCTLTVVLPWVLEALARLAFSGGRATLAVHLAGIRGVLMPGSGLSRQRELLEGLALLERRGLDAALAHFHNLAGESEDGGELALIHEQIVSMLFYGQRWDEGIAHYEERFHPGYAAMRPTLALGLLRAYGESGRLEHAASVLRGLEEGPVGHDPRALPLLSQARLTFLAYAGLANVVGEAATEEHWRALGLSPASGALFCGIALARAGHGERAQEELRRAERLAEARDERVVAASRHAIEQLERPPVELEPELRRYAQTVAEHLRTFLAAAPSVRFGGNLRATPVLIALLVLGYVTPLVLDRGGMGVLQAGALTPELLRAGSWGRVLTGLFVQAEPIELLLNVYGVWLAAPLIERNAGPLRVVLVAVVGGALALLGGAMTVVDPAAVLAGGNMLAVAAIVGALWTLLPRASPGLPRRARRALAIPLSLILVAQLLAAVPGRAPMDVPPQGLLIAAVAATVLAGLLPAAVRRIPRAVEATVVALLAVATLGSVAWVASEDVEGFAQAHRLHRIEHDGVRFHVPDGFALREPGENDEFPIAAHVGVVHDLEVRVGGLVQLLVVSTDGGGDEEGAEDEPALFRLDPKLRREVSVGRLGELPARLVDALGELPFRAWALRRNGEVVAHVVERPLDGGSTVVLVASPAAGLAHAPALYGSILADAEAVAAR